MYDWIIIGGGIHGCTIATYLLKHKITSINRMKIIDLHDEPLFEWKKRTRLIGMKHLRSPSVHHIDVDPYSLQRYAKKNFHQTSFFGPYKRPSLELFNEHCEYVLSDIQIERAWHRGVVRKSKRLKDRWHVELEDQSIIEGKNVVLTISINGQFLYPDWALPLLERHPSKILHISNPKLEQNKLSDPPFIVVGGGMTAAHITIKLAEVFPGRVTLLTRHNLRIKDFDSDPGWLGPKYLAGFQRTSNLQERRQIIKSARNKGSIPGELYRKLKKLENNGQITISISEIQSATEAGEGYELTLKEEGTSLKAKTIVLATGFQPDVPGGKLIDQLVQVENLQCAECGYPIVNSSLEWCPHLYVSGPLAELEIGPIARNISGARHAAERIVSSIK